VNSKTRILHELSFVINSIPFWLRKIFSKKYNLVLSIAPPFHITFPSIVYSKIKRVKLVNHIQDLQVDAAKELNMITNKKFLKIMFSMEKYTLNNSSVVSILTSGMKNKVLEKGIPDSKIIFLPNWVDTEKIKPMGKAESLRDAFGILPEEEVILYSGNMGRKQGLDLVIKVAEELKEEKNIRFVLVGSGVGKKNLENYAKSKNLKNVSFYSLQPYEKLPMLLAIADLHLVLQKKSASDLVMPSKLSSILASGGCAIITAMPGTSLYEDTKRHNFGILCEPESKKSLKDAIISGLNSNLMEKKQNARKYAESFLNKDMILNKFLNQVMQSL
jgi:colanic acid biosynthesis glycosyl transferase WcaI